MQLAAVGDRRSLRWCRGDSGGYQRGHPHLVAGALVTAVHGLGLKYAIDRLETLAGCTT